MSPSFPSAGPLELPRPATLLVDERNDKPNFGTVRFEGRDTCEWPHGPAHYVRSNDRAHSISLRVPCDSPQAAMQVQSDMVTGNLRLRYTLLSCRDAAEDKLEAVELVRPPGEGKHKANGNYLALKSPIQHCPDEVFAGWTPTGKKKTGDTAQCLPPKSGTTCLFGHGGYQLPRYVWNCQTVKLSDCSVVTVTIKVVTNLASRLYDCNFVWKAELLDTPGRTIVCAQSRPIFFFPNPKNIVFDKLDEAPAPSRPSLPSLSVPSASPLLSSCVPMAAFAPATSSPRSFVASVPPSLGGSPRCQPQPSPSLVLQFPVVASAPITSSPRPYGNQMPPAGVSPLVPPCSSSLFAPSSPRFGIPSSGLLTSQVRMATPPPVPSFPTPQLNGILTTPPVPSSVPHATPQLNGVRGVTSQGVCMPVAQRKRVRAATSQPKAVPVVRAKRPKATSTRKSNILFSQIDASFTLDDFKALEDCRGDSNSDAICQEMNSSEWEEFESLKSFVFDTEKSNPTFRSMQMGFQSDEDGFRRP